MVDNTVLGWSAGDCIDTSLELLAMKLGVETGLSTPCILQRF